MMIIPVIAATRTSTRLMKISGISESTTATAMAPSGSSVRGDSLVRNPEPGSCPLRAMP